MRAFSAWKDTVYIYTDHNLQVVKVELSGPFGEYHNIPRGLGSNRLWSACQDKVDSHIDHGPDGMDMAKELREECWNG